MLAYNGSDNRWYNLFGNPGPYAAPSGGSSFSILCTVITTSYTRYHGMATAQNGYDSYPDLYARKSDDGKTIYWYNNVGSEMNSSGCTYYWMAIG